MWKFFYNYIFFPTIILILKLSGLFIYKIKIGIDGRDNLFQNLEEKIKKFKDKKFVWFHSSSMGEFEQAKPIIASLKKEFPNIGVVVTFFSPSGYLNAKNYKLADIISYIPIDTEKNVIKFLNLLNPVAAIMIRYDVWPNFTWELKNRNIPLILVNGTLKNNSTRFFPLIKTLHKELFNCFTNIFVVAENDKSNFLKLNVTIPEITVNGDTRFDQVVERRNLSHSTHLLPTTVTSGKRIFIAAQTWKEDEEIIFPSLIEFHNQNPNLLTLIVPHEPTETTLDRIENELGEQISLIRFSHLNDFNNEKIILVDSVGILIPLYQYCNFAFVGGSFKQGIHNVLEPAAFGMPIIFGPKHKNSSEAIELKNISAGFEINDSREFNYIFKRFLNSELETQIVGKVSKDFVENNLGSTKRFTEFLANQINKN